MAKSFRKYDSNSEKEVAKFLDMNFYASNVSDFIRFEDKINQLKGKDVKFSIDNLKNIIVDEKAQIYYINKNLPTFAFEINFIRNSGHLTPGWLLDKDKETEYYLLIWISADKEKGFVSEDITKLECLLIERKKIMDFLEKQGLDSKKINSISEKIRKRDVDGKCLSGEYDYCYFYLSKKLAENPLNIIIYKRKLIELSTKKFIVTKKN